MGSQSPIQCEREVPTCCLKSLDESPIYTRYGPNSSFQALGVRAPPQLPYSPILLPQFSPISLQAGQSASHEDPSLEPEQTQSCPAFLFYSTHFWEKCPPFSSAVTMAEVLLLLSDMESHPPLAFLNNSFCLWFSFFFTCCFL